MSEATSTITTPVGETFTISWTDPRTGLPSGPSYTYRRTVATDVEVGDCLADTFGSPGQRVESKRLVGKQVRLTYVSGLTESLWVDEIVNALVAS